MNLGCVFDRSESIRSFIYGIITMRNLITCKWIHLCLVLVLVKFVLNDCPFPPKKLPHGRFLYQSPKDKNATTVVENYLLRFKCFRKFNLIGNKAIVCVEGKWTGFVPTCAKMQCSEPPEIDNGVSDVHTGVNSVPVIGATAEYFCDKGYELKNATVSTLTCVLTKSNSVTWAGEVPSCIKKESCIDPGVSVDGKREGDCCFAGDILKFSCDEDYELVGHSEIQCLANAEWTFERPLCRPLEDHCATPPAIPHGRVEGFKEGDYYLPYDEVDVICERGYSYEGESPIILCEEDGEWEMEFGKCVEASCELPQALANGTILELQSTNLTTFPYSYELTYVCDKGFRLVEGDSWRFCCVGGHEGICDDSGWSGRTPYCEVIKCPDPGVPEHGSREGKSFDVGAKVHFSCSAGYELLGSFERHCRPNGQWTGELARCDTKTNYCSNPGIPINGYKNSSNYDMGDIVGFGCIKDYTQLGSKSRLCLPNRTWSGTETICLGPYDYDRGAQVSDSLKASINSKVVEQRKKLKKYRQDFYSAFHRNGSFVPVGRILDLNYPGRLILYFVFDSSGSVGKENFEKSVEFAKAIVKKVGISKSGARAGAVIFSSKAEIMFSPLVYETTEDVLEALGRIDFTGGGTAANSALTLVREELIPLTQAVLGRKGQKSVLFILTDGRANMGGDPKEEAQELKNAGVEIYCIGITGSVKKKTLYSMASDSTAEPPEPHVFILDNYATLAWLIQEITNGTIDYSKCGLGMEEAGDRIPRARILGGNYTVKPWPWMVALYFIPLGKFDPSEAELLCGGSIIHEKFVLTAAHCMFAKDKKGKKERRNVNEIILKLGLTNVKNESFTQKPEVNEIYLHPKYSSTSGNYDYDIALLQLKNPIEYSARIRPICLPPKEQLPDSSFYEAKEFGLVTGWGHKDVVIPGTDFQIKSTEDLKELILPIQSRQNCKESLKEKHVPEAYFTKQMFCAGDGRGGNDTCQGDSGGPFMQSQLNEDGYLYWTQVGIVSWGVGCGLPNTYGYYSHVQILRGWIDNTIEQAMNKNVEENI